MTSDTYLYGIISKNKQAGTYTPNEDKAFADFKSHFEANYKKIIGADTWRNISLTVQQSGSRAKGTALRGRSDIDLFFSISDPDNYRTLEEHYNAIHYYTKNNLSDVKNVRKQKVSIGATYNDLDIDIIPAKRVNSDKYERRNDHYLWVVRKEERTLTNIQKHIDTVRGSGVQDEIILTKRWAVCHNLDISSFYLELLVIDALQNSRSFGIDQRWRLGVLPYIANNICDKIIIDPANSKNFISDTLSQEEKSAVERRARLSMNATQWSEIIW